MPLTDIKWKTFLNFECSSLRFISAFTNRRVIYYYNHHHNPNLYRFDTSHYWVSNERVWAVVSIRPNADWKLHTDRWIASQVYVDVFFQRKPRTKFRMYFWKLRSTSRGLNPSSTWDAIGKTFIKLKFYWLRADRPKVNALSTIFYELIAWSGWVFGKHPTAFMAVEGQKFACYRRNITTYLQAFIDKVWRSAHSSTELLTRGRYTPKLWVIMY